MRIIINKTKAILSGMMVVFFGGYGIYYIFRGPWLAAVLFLAVAALFGWLFYRNGSTLTVDGEGVRLAFLNHARKALSWSEIREVGLIGENVFNHGKKHRTGDKYIYFSPETMTADERFNMIVQWPPKDRLYVQYQERLLEYAMTYWPGTLQTYNVEDIFPNSDEPTGSPQKRPARPED